MKRTRKWSFVAQEAARLAKLGASPVEIARQLGIHKATVYRQIAAGHLKVGESSHAVLAQMEGGQTPEQWATTVRETYDLDATDDQLVTLAENALVMAREATDPKVRISAIASFRSVVKQLALVTKSKPDEQRETDVAPAPTRKTNPVRMRKHGADPRTLLMAVK